MEFIDLKTQYKDLKETIDRRIAAVLHHGQFIMGPEIMELEKELALRTGSNHCIACASGTDALMIALMALEIRPGDEVITSPFTFIATAEMIALVGATPVFVDIEPDTYNLDPRLLRKAITPKTKAIMPVSLYGQCADIDAINEIAGDIPVIEDAAQSFGATYKGQQSCNLSTIGCTSFFPSKPLGCYGDGGACFTNDDALARKMRQIRVHGQDRRYHHPVIGFNGRLDTLQAAILLGKLTAFDGEVKKRAEVGARYTELLRKDVKTPTVPPHNTSVYAQYTVAVENRVVVQQYLQQRGIPTAVHYPISLHMQPAFAYLGLGKGSFPESEHAAERVLSLPMHPYLTAADQLRVANSLIECSKAVVAEAASRQ
ncbi:MAG TPA: DegT/DnrJ/EryC1/StrS family aminotransferase [Candidatus Koribacter sp.]|jgi:UDP-2-acetamido-2-deoxy-ribo-hexuluronate aminotransferase